MKFFSLFILMIALVACSKSETESTSTAENHQEVSQAELFEQKLDSLDNVEQQAAVLAEKEQTHLDYGIYLIYNSNPASMRENANNALRQFIEVLKINPDNEKAIAEIEQILSIYRTFPNRTPEEDVAEDLKELGFEI